MRRSYPRAPFAQSAHPGSSLGPAAWTAAFALPGQSRSVQVGDEKEKRDTPWHQRPGPWAVAFRRSVGPGQRRAGTLVGPGTRRIPQVCPPGRRSVRLGHSLGYAGRNEGQSNSTTRRTKDLTGIVRRTLTGDWNVLGQQARYFRAKKGGLRAVGALQRLPPARKRSQGWGVGSKSYGAPPPPRAKHQGQGDHAPPCPAPPRCACSLGLRNLAPREGLGKS